MIFWNVYIRREVDGQIFDRYEQGLTTAQCQSLRVSEQNTPGHLLEFDAVDIPGPTTGTS